MPHRNLFVLIVYFFVQIHSSGKVSLGHSFLGRLRAKTGIQTFDLPSEMKWEYACRAGCSSALNSGAGVNNPWSEDPEMNKVGRYKYNGGIKFQGDVMVPDQGTARVGSYRPNAWGLYDMHGNVWEWCLDFYADDNSGFDGRVNTVQTWGVHRVQRGGGWDTDATHCRSASRRNYSQATARGGFGFRLVCAVGG